MVRELTDEDFAADVLDNPLPCLILFTGSWCTWCGEMLERFEVASKRFEGEAEFFTADIDVQKKLRIAFAVGTLPFTVMVRDGEKSPLFDQIVPEEDIVERVRYALDGGRLPVTTPVRWKE